MTEGFNSKQYGVPTKRYVQTMDLKDDDDLIRRYREAHDKEHFWDEIKDGIRQVGILEMEIYILLTSSLKKHAFYNLLINNILYLCVT